ncbi:lysylphosphatidylglycerol synthase transmembrane domain-containing protein [Limnovirga soli]|uniref:Flippase-like domain-containing protein n=1 Tax=Limnovirga soli TaxID=2656915 RepID=A0A8J8FJR2_9BACT|nr:lysylphosphatidylglycerol synthase transmembrane domain-containing protein [Limnovirga soli]NNV56319.1 flippase-like domain-containing protein [Limnovirga soli]
MSSVSKLPSWLKLFIKLMVTGLCLWYVSNKIDWSKSWQTLQRANIFWLLVATILFAGSKIVAACRLNIYFKNMQLQLSQKTNLQLYWLGMFYNLFLPGGIGGDAYKVILLTKTHHQPAKLLTAAVLLDRISGVAGLAVLAALYYYAVYSGGQYALLLVLAILPCIGLYYVVVNKFFPSFIKGFWSTFWMGLLVQGLQVLCAYSIMQSLHLYNHSSPYILIFLLSSIVAILPFTIGGLGAREVVFIWGSTQFLLNQEESVCISLLFYLITVFISTIGVFWVYKAPIANQDNNNNPA